MSAFDLPSPTHSGLDTLSRLLYEAQSTSSKTEKQEIVQRYVAENDSVADWLFLALSPTVTFGVQRLPEAESAITDATINFENVGRILLDKLAKRSLTGGVAAEAISSYMRFLPRHEEPGAISLFEAFKRVLLKDLRAGFGDSTVNKAVKGLIPTFPYMRCSLEKDVDLGSWPWASGEVTSQEKADGMFANLNVETSGLVQLSSRQGSLFPMDAFSSLQNEAVRRLAPGHQYHGELLVRRAGQVLPREQSNGILNSVLQGGQFGADEVAIYLTWDVIPLDAVEPKGKHNVPYFIRINNLMDLLARTDGPDVTIRVIETEFPKSLEEAYGHYRKLLSIGREGTIVKHPKAIWRDGTSKEQVKLKLEVDVDLEVVGFTAGNGKHASTFGAVELATSDRLLRVDASGFTDAMRADLHARREQVAGMIMTIRANSIMPPSESNPLYSLFLPRFVELRTDKTEADSLERVKAQFASAVAA